MVDDATAGGCEAQAYARSATSGGRRPSLSLELWSLPASMYVRILRYDPILFDEAGLAYPGGDWTWGDLLEAARQISGVQGAEQRYGLLIWLDTPFLVEVLAGQLLDVGVDPPHYRFSDPDVAVAVRKVMELVQDGVIPAPTLEAHPEAQGGVAYGMMPLDEAIRDGRVGMWLERPGEAHWGLGEYGYPASLPLGSWEDTISVPWAYYIAADTPHVEACWQWLRFLSEQIPPDGNLPPRYSLLTSDAYRQRVGESFYSVYLETLESATQSFQSKLDELPLGYRWPEQWFRQALHEIVWQGEDVVDTLDDVQNQADAFRACMQRYVGRESLEAVQGCAQEARPEGPGFYLLTAAEAP